MSTHSTTSSGRLLRATVILAWIITLLALLVGGGYTAFIRPDFWPLMAGALFVLVLFLLAMLGKPGHSHATNPLSVVAAGMVVMLPVIYLPLARGQSLGNYAFEKRFVHDSNMSDSSAAPVASPEAGSSSSLAARNSASKPDAPVAIQGEPVPPPTPSDPSAPANDPASAAALAMQTAGAQASLPPATQPAASRVWDQRAVAAATVEEVTISDLVLSPETYLKKHVVIEGMFKNDSRLPKNYYAAYRFIIICCAADAQPSVIFLKTQKPYDFVDGSWVRIQGKLVKEKLAGEEMTLLDVESIEPTPQPERPYMYYTPRTTYDVSTAPTPAGPDSGSTGSGSADLK